MLKILRLNDNGAGIAQLVGGVGDNDDGHTE